MAQRLLDKLLTIETLPEAEREEFAKGLYIANKYFARLVDMAYTNKLRSQFRGEYIPKYKQDNVPYGYHYSSLEMIGDRLEAAAFEKKDGSGKPVKRKRRRQLLIQIFEALSDVENKFVKQVLNGNVPYLPFATWCILVKENQPIEQMKVENA